MSQRPSVSMQVSPFAAPTIAAQISDIGALVAMRELQEKAPGNNIQIDGFVIHFMTHSVSESFRNSIANLRVGDPGRDLANFSAAAATEVKDLFNKRVEEESMIASGSEEGAAVVAFDKLQKGHDLYVGVSSVNPYLNRVFAMALCERLGCKTPCYEHDLLEYARELFVKHGVVSVK